MRFSRVIWFVAVCCAAAGVKNFAAGDVSHGAADSCLFVIMTVHTVVAYRRGG